MAKSDDELAKLIGADFQKTQKQLEKIVGSNAAQAAFESQFKPSAGTLAMMEADKKANEKAKKLFAEEEKYRKKAGKAVQDWINFLQKTHKL
ncbi:MAG: hypothetical protein WCT04_02380 [Planctomycetota bacterium]